MKQLITWLLDLISNFRLHAIVFVLLLLVCAYVIFSNLIVNIILLLSLLFFIFPLRSWEKCQSDIGESMQTSYLIESFNIQWDSPEHSRVLEYIEKSEADILVLQEVTKSLKEVIKKYQHNYPNQIGEGHSHVMVLSKHKLEFVEFLPWPGKFQQRALHIKCLLPDEVLHILAIHLQVTRSWKQIGPRDEQIATLVEKANSINQALMVVGDFNAATGSNVLTRIENKTALVANESLLNSHATWPVRAGALGIQLDHFYVNNKLMLGTPELGPVLDSDHRPISTRFRFV